ncbi:hypothetical protein B6V73_00020 [Thioclava sp. JM3]|uniref:helix-turn-helix transcriptional regulator n=1 Tax=unclassified Thioclava TaxID=2621713 RepID=UPI000B53FE3D|nr:MULTISPECIES: hypothetical protein [unclassified Thioclava]OWY18241.1 hypothetical protein B6V73_00020 [Thioclava sp. JM3]PWE48639.1 hypothetical protein DEM26_17795 [Thioclava sp. NG1]
MLAVDEPLRLFVSFYAVDAEGDVCDPELARLARPLALLHFERALETGVPAPLTVLSYCELAVCLGILSGRKFEAIVLELGITHSTVITYRKRAYGKLGTPPAQACSQFARDRTRRSVRNSMAARAARRAAVPQG